MKAATGSTSAEVYRTRNSVTNTNTNINDFKNSDGSYSLYDNKRHDPDSNFHEQILSVTPSTPSFDLIEGNIGLGGIEADIYTGGWEWEHGDLSLFDFGHAEASAEYKNGDFSLGAFASVWSPNGAITVFGVTVGLSVEVGAVGGEIEASSKNFSLKGAFGFGLGLSFSW